jgi:hypothetical protein
MKHKFVFEVGSEVVFAKIMKLLKDSRYLVDVTSEHDHARGYVYDFEVGNDGLTVFNVKSMVIPGALVTFVSDPSRSVTHSDDGEIVIEVSH